MNLGFSHFIKLLLVLIICASCTKSDNVNLDAKHDNTKSTGKEAVSAPYQAEAVENAYNYDIVFHDITLHYEDITALDLEEKKAELEIVKTELLELFKKNSQLNFLQKEPLTSTVALERRANNDVASAIKIMESYGFYASTADFTIDLDQEPYLVTLNLYPNSQYSIGEVKIKYTQPDEVTNVFFKNTRMVGFLKKREAKAYSFEFPEQLENINNKRAKAADILSAANALIYPLTENGFPEARLVSTGFAVDKEKLKINGTVFINHGMPALMGAVKVEGNEKVSSNIIKKLATWRRDEVWNESKIIEYIHALQKTGLFSKIDISYDRKVYQDYRKNVQAYKAYLREKNRQKIGSSSKTDQEIEDGFKIKQMPEPIVLPVKVLLTESTSKTLSGSAFYSTDTGFGVRAAWEHRNFFGNAERVRLELPLSQDEALFSAEYRQIAFMHPKQELIIRGRGGYEDTDAYERNFMDLGFGISREINERWSVENILYFDLVEPKDEPNEISYHSFRLENSIQYDRRNNKENPTGGYIAKFVFSPLWGHDYEDFYSYATEVEGTIYKSIADHIVLVARLGLGIMPGSPYERIPRSERFFIGGNNTVRGFAYQELGPHDKDDDPLGGLSYNFYNFEARYNLTKELSIIPFVDAGMVYEDNEPRLGQDLAFGAGIGGRYLTPVGPIRLDLAIPLTKPNETTDKEWTDFQIYISIGQEF